jgi:hypothetical protein
MGTILDAINPSRQLAIFETIERERESQAIVAWSSEGQPPIFNPPSPERLRAMMEQVRASMLNVIVVAYPEAFTR